MTGGSETREGHCLWVARRMGRKKNATCTVLPVFVFILTLYLNACIFNDIFLSFILLYVSPVTKIMRWLQI